MGLTFGQTGKGAWDPQASLKDIQVMARDKNAVVDLMFEEGLIDDYIRHWSSMQTTPGLQNLSNEDIYYMREEFKDPQHKEAITEWFIQNEYNTLLDQYNSSIEAGPTGGVTMQGGVGSKYN